jgi:hypothetical protein
MYRGMLYAMAVLNISAVAWSCGTAVAEDKALATKLYATIGKDAIGQEEAACEQSSATEMRCTISGLRIKSRPDGSCAIATEIDIVDFSLNAGRWINVDGPGGTCGTTLIQEINSSRYTFKEIATDKTGVCAKLPDFQIDYTHTNWLKARQDLACSSFEFTPAMSIQEPY